ncbi:MAG: type II toxin-antitoxin system prevent-host-death family antitoxin [Gammaproteobacteria bacterium]|nr:type II toxin-antitoxin system prevent-host-death family antitoxin [Gammaproteobacteria bacterium]
MHEAKSKLSQLAEKAWGGDKIVIAKAGKPYLDLIPHKEKIQERTPGRYKGQVKISDEFTNTPQEIIDLFDGDKS